MKGGSYRALAPPGSQAQCALCISLIPSQPPFASRRLPLCLLSLTGILAQRWKKSNLEH